MKKIIALGSLLVGIGVGEYFSPYQSTKDSIAFHNMPTAEGFPQDPWNYKVQREIEELHGEQVQTIYLVNEVKGIHKKIDEHGCSCGIKNSLDDFFLDSKNWLEEKIDRGKEWLSD